MADIALSWRTSLSLEKPRAWEAPNPRVLSRQERERCKVDALLDVRWTMVHHAMIDDRLMALAVVVIVIVCVYER